MKVRSSRFEFWVEVALLLLGLHVLALAVFRRYSLAWLGVPLSASDPTAALVLIFLLMVGLGGGNLGAWRSVPWYALTAGAAGLVIIGALSYTVPRLGLVPTFTIFVASQFMVGALFDHFGLLGAAVRLFDVSRLVGVVILLLGVWLIIR